MSGIVLHWSEIVRAWAAKQPLVLEAYGYGSRVKGGYSPESDVDIAIEVAGFDDDEKLANSIIAHEKWQTELQSLLPVIVDLHFMTPDDTIVAPAVREHGLLLYKSS